VAVTLTEVPPPVSQRVRTVAVAVGAVALVAALLSAGRWVLDTGPTVTFLGDSITVISADDISSTLDRDYRPEYSAVLGIQTGQLLPAARTAAEADPDQVVIDLGTNDVLQKAPLDESDGHLAELVGLFPGSRCIHLVTINTNMAAYGISYRSRAQEINRSIRRLAASDPRIGIIDWDAAMSADVAAHPPGGTLTSDSIHPNDAGKQVLARSVRTALDDCRR
jgi:lysophospholipase L1-like esterase